MIISHEKIELEAAGQNAEQPLSIFYLSILSCKAIMPQKHNWIPKRNIATSYFSMLLCS